MSLFKNEMHFFAHDSYVTFSVICLQVTCQFFSYVTHSKESLF